MKCCLRLLIACICLFVTSATYAAPQLEKIAESHYQWTGVAVSQTGRIFVNYPTWSHYPSFKVAEIIDGQQEAYPNETDNHKFICVQSVIVDKNNDLWILDPAKLRGQNVAESGAKLFKVDLRTNKITAKYVFPKTAVLPKSYLNDVRIDTKRKFAYLTDSDLGGIVVLDLQTGDAWRALDSEIPEVQANLNGILFESTGFWAKKGNSDGMELSADGDILYFTALTGNVLYAVPTALLRDKALDSAARRKSIRILSKQNVPADGMAAKENKLYMGDLAAEGIWEFDLAENKGKRLELPQKVRWADSFSVDSVGNVYFTTSQINYPPEQRTAYELYKLSW